MIDGLPQRNNEANDFNQLVVTDVHAASLEAKRCRLLHVYVDRVSVDSHFISTQLHTFLYGK